MDRREIATGNQDFEDMRINGDFYVDKTDLIREWWNSRDAVTLITRPRRFGKTLNMSMMKCFFSNEYANRGELFEGLKVWEDPEFREIQGAWPVIFLTFADVKANNYEDTRHSLNQLIVDVYTKYEWLLKTEGFANADRKYYSQVASDMNNAVAAVALKKLSEWLYRYYGKKVLIFLDEYDTPLQEAYIHGYWDELTAYIRSLFNSTFKSNPSLERAILTGITRVSKESIFSDLNNLEVVTTTSDKYATAFGFTEEEVFRAMEEKGFTEQDQREVKSWYDGFTFGSVTDIYNPWSVINYLDKRKVDTYWANTSGNGLVGMLLRTATPQVKTQFETLLSGGTITVCIDEQIVFNQLARQKDAIWSMLLATGYLRIVSVDDSQFHRFDSDLQKFYTLCLTNLEVKKMFRDMISGWFDESEVFPDFVRAMLRGNVREMNRYMNEVALTVFSSFDSGKGPSTRAPERFYHGFVLGLMVDRAADYVLKSNRESGYGRYDVVMEPKDPANPAVIMEFKVFDEEDEEKTLEDTAMNALKQIEEKKYDTELLTRGIPIEHIMKYGLAFQGKKCLIRKA